jgi:hypothetical protein
MPFQLINALILFLQHFLGFGQLSCIFYLLFGDIRLDEGFLFFEGDLDHINNALLGL